MWEHGKHHFIVCIDVHCLYAYSGTCPGLEEWWLHKEALNLLIFNIYG